MQDRVSSYSQQEVKDAEIICFDKKIYVPLTVRRHVLCCYHFYFNHPRGIRLKNTTR